jgi:hypothetical protein
MDRDFTGLLKGIRSIRPQVPPRSRIQGIQENRKKIAQFRLTRFLAFSRPVFSHPFSRQRVFAWGGRTVSVRAAHAEAAETLRAASEPGPADSETLRTGKFEGCAIYALSNVDLREACSHLPVCDPAQQRVFAELLRRRRSAAQKRLAARAGGRRKSPWLRPGSLQAAA